MKFLSKVVLVIFFIGLVFTVIAFSRGIELNNLSSYFIDDEAYGDALDYTTSTTIDHLNIDVETRNVQISVSASDSIVVTYHAHEDDTWTINETEGTLNIIQTAKPFTVHWFNFKFPSYGVVTIYVEIPASLILDYTLKSDVGDIKYNDGPQLTTAIDIESATGDIELSDISMDSLIIDLNTGDINLSDLTITGNVNVSSDTGKVFGSNIIALGLNINTSTGRIEISNSEVTNSMDLSTSTGRIKIANSVADDYDLSTSTGNIEFISSSVIAFKFDLSTSTGDVIVYGDDQGTKHTTSTGTIPLKARASTGDITIRVQD